MWNNQKKTKHTHTIFPFQLINLDNALLDIADDNEMIRKRSWTHVWLNWIQIQLKRIEIQIGAKGIENLLIIHDYDIEKN